LSCLLTKQAERDHGVARAACFERLAGVFASRAASLSITINKTAHILIETLRNRVFYIVNPYRTSPIKLTGVAHKVLAISTLQKGDALSPGNRLSVIN
jgi:hypothetical protein